MLHLENRQPWMVAGGPELPATLEPVFMTRMTHMRKMLLIKNTAETPPQLAAWDAKSSGSIWSQESCRVGG